MQEKSLESVITSTEVEIKSYDEQLKTITNKRNSLMDDLEEKRQALETLKNSVEEAEATYLKVN